MDTSRVVVFCLILMILATSVILPGTTEAQSIEWNNFVDSFLHDFFAHNPSWGVYVGRHEFDGQLPDWTQTGLGRYESWLGAQREKALGFDAESLSEDQRFEQQHLLQVLAEQEFQLSGRREPFTNPLYYTGDLSPDTYATREYASLEVRLKAYTAHAKAIPVGLSQMQNNLERPLPRTYVETTIRVLEGLVTYFQDDIPKIFADVEDEALQAGLVEANGIAISALERSAIWFKDQLAASTDGYALGEERFLEMLRIGEGVEISLAELKEAGEWDLERNLASLESACGQFAPGESLGDCVKKAAALKPEGGPVPGARAQLAGLKKFVLDNELVTIPGREEALVEEAPPYQRWNFAYINIPGPYEEDLPSTYYIAPPDPTWSEEKQHDYLPGRMDLKFISVHEVWPGHFLHNLHSRRVKSRFAQIFGSYAFSEGWAHYTEEMMWDAGLGKGDPETHIGQLTNALLRNVRYLSAIGLHCEGMTVDESEALFMEKGFQDSGKATQQAVRGTFDPGYLNYTLGKLMILKLREDWTASRGGRESWRDFHDRFLSYGGPPIPLVRKSMLGEAAAESSLLPGRN